MLHRFEEGVFVAPLAGRNLAAGLPLTASQVCHRGCFGGLGLAEILSMPPRLCTTNLAHVQTADQEKLSKFGTATSETA